MPLAQALPSDVERPAQVRIRRVLHAELQVRHPDRHAQLGFDVALARQPARLDALRRLVEDGAHGHG